MRFPRPKLQLAWQPHASPFLQKRAITYIARARLDSPFIRLQRLVLLHGSIIHARPLNRRFCHSGERADQSDPHGSREEDTGRIPKVRSFDFKDPGPLPASLHNRKYPTTFPLARKILKKYHGYSSFRGEQEKVIARLQERGPAIYIMPTGGGKSLVFQVLARTIPDEGVILIVEPLISLLRVSAVPICALSLYSTKIMYFSFFP